MHRTTILLDDASRLAAKALASHLDISPSEAMRRALLRYRDELLGESKSTQQKRIRLLDQLVEASSETTPAEEIAQRKREDESW